MGTPTPYEVAIAVSRAQQTDPDLARRLLCEYNNDDGVDMLRVAYCMSQLIAKADQRITHFTYREEGDWLANFGTRAANAAIAASPEPSSSE